MDCNSLTGTNLTSAMWGNLNVDDGFGKPGSLSIQKKSENESKFLFVQDFCMHAALSHYVLHVAFMIVRFEYAKLQVVITVIACMEIPEGKGADEIISKRDIEEKDLLDVQVLCPFTAYNYDRTYFDVSDIAQLSSMDGGLQDDLTMDEFANDDNFFRDARDIDGTIWMSLNKANAAIPIYTLSLSARKNDLSLFTLSPITFIEVSGSEVSGSEVSGCKSFQALIDSSALGIVWRKMKKLCSQEVYKEPVDTNKSDHEDLSDEKVRKGFINKTAAYQSNVIHRPACNLGATSLFIKNLIIALMCFAMVNPATGGPVLDKMKMVDKDEAVYHEFPLLKSNWCQNPEQPTDTCPNRDFVMKLKVQTCQYKCPAGEKVLCLESEVGMVFFCIQEDLRCDEGISWQVESIEHRGSDKVVIIKESPCPDGFYQSLPSECYDACKDEHEPLRLIPGPFKIISLGNNTHPTMLRCKHEDGFYNPKNQSYIRFNQDDFRMDFCTNVRDLNPCKSGQMPLYNGTCVNHCSHGYVRDDTDFFCKINGTLEPAGNSLSEAGPKKELGERKEKGKDGDRDVQRNKEGNKSEHPYQIPWYMYLVLGVIGIAILLISIKLFCFPNRSEQSGVYSQVPTNSNTSSEVTLEGNDKGKSGDAESLDTFSTSEGTEKGKSRDVESNSLDTLSTSKDDDDDDMSDSTSDEERTNESKVGDDETFPKEAIDTQPVVKKEIGPVKAYSSNDDDDDMSDSEVDDETFPKEAIDTQTVVKKEIGPVKASSSKSSGRKVKKKYRNNLFIRIDKVDKLNLGSVSSKEDMSALMKSLCDEQQIPEESVKMDFLKIVSEKDDQGNGPEQELLQDVETLTPEVGRNVTSEEIEDLGRN